MDQSTSSTSSSSSPNIFQKIYRTISIRYQSLLDGLTPFLIARWFICAVLFALYVIRVFIVQGFHIISYALGIYLLNLFIGFLTPKIDPAMDDYNDDEPSLPTRASEEFRPFMRRLPEFKFWHSTTKAFIIAICCTFVKALDIPVFWPILVMYFVLLFTITMKRQIRHMIKYRYLPFTYGKPRHKSKENSANIVSS